MSLKCFSILVYEYHEKRIFSPSECYNSISSVSVTNGKWILMWIKVECYTSDLVTVQITAKMPRAANRKVGRYSNSSTIHILQTQNWQNSKYLIMKWFFHVPKSIEYYYRRRNINIIVHVQEIWTTSCETFYEVIWAVINCITTTSSGCVEVFFLCLFANSLCYNFISYD